MPATLTLDYVRDIELGELQQLKNVAVTALFEPKSTTVSYLTLSEALRDGILRVTEINASGSVPKLKVTNSSDSLVLLLDGEELTGAKQNRVLNTSVLLAARSETVIPVSCTEAGRWAYTSAAFEESGNIMPGKLRANRARAVSSSLDSIQEFRSDQSAVWNGIDRMAEAAAVESPTSSMADIYEAKQKELDDYLDAFSCVPNQKGLLVFVKGSVAGFDILSSSAAYEILHSKFVKSYVMDALLQKHKSRVKAKLGNASEFLDALQSCADKRFKSAGLGWDHRFEGSTIVGSSLVNNDTVVHAAFFKVDPSAQVGWMAGYARRSEYRMRR